jgi:fluoride exporter
MDFFIIGTAGFLGAILRYFLYLPQSGFSSLNFPYATLSINLGGCFLAGILAGVATKVAPEHRHYVMIILVGFVGSFTTFSTFSAETLYLIDSNHFFKALLNISLNLFGGLLMVWMGRVITS